MGGKKLKSEITEEKFVCSYKKHYEQLFYFAYAFVNDRETCRDILSNVFEMMWAKRSTLREETITSFLYSCVRNRCMDFLRHDQAARNYVGFLESATDYNDSMSMEEHEHRLEMIAQAVAELPDRTRYILEQCYFEHKKYAEVAESLSVTRDAVKKQISKALSILRQKLNVINF